MKEDSIKRLKKIVILASASSPMCCITTGLRSSSPAAFIGWKEAIVAFTLHTRKHCSIFSDRFEFIKLPTSSISCSSSRKGRCIGKCCLRRKSSNSFAKMVKMSPCLSRLTPLILSLLTICTKVLTSLADSALHAPRLGLNERAGKARARCPGYPANFRKLKPRDFPY